jgi:hypothetical protein
VKKQLLIYILISQCCFAQHWDTLVGTSNRPVTVIYNDTTAGKLFIGGQFTSIGNKTIWGVAQWQNQIWDSLGHGIDDISLGNMPRNTWAIARFDSSLYVGGAFYLAGNHSTPYLAVWKNNQWDTTFPFHPNNVVENILTYNNELYTCGVFDSINNISCKGIAKWNGLTWQAVGNNYDFTNSGMGIFDMCFYHGNLFISGTFRDPVGNTCRLARWNGFAWQFYTNEVRGSLAGINDMKVYNNELYIGGRYLMSDGNITNCIMKWNDTIWSDVGGGIDLLSNQFPTIKGMIVHNNKLYCVGSFEKVGGIAALGLASWDGVNWCGYGTNFETSPGNFCGADCIEFYNDTMYVAGGFNLVDGIFMPHLVKWIGGNYVSTCGNTTGIQENSGSFFVSVFPNPASSVITFQMLESSASEIIITDQLGREVHRKKINGEQQVKIPVDDLPDGMYFYQYVENHDKKRSGKFVVVH